MNKRYEKLCRACLKTSRNLFSFAKEVKIKDETLTISDFYMLVLNVRLSYKDHSVSKICTKCFELLKAFHEFKTNAIINDKFFRLYISDSKQEPDSDSDDERILKTEIADVVEENNGYLKEETADIPDDNQSGQNDAKENHDMFEDLNFNDSDTLLEEMNGLPENYDDLEEEEEEDELEDDENSEEDESDEELLKSEIKNVKKPNVNSNTGPDKAQCTVCKTWMKRETIPRHMRRLHKNQKPLRYSKDFKCTVKDCGKEFVSNWQLQYHLNIHNNKRLFNCRLCDCGYFRHYHLKRHMLAKHVTNVQFTCYLCKRKFAKKFLLSQHLKKFHKELSNKELRAELNRVSKCIEFLGETPEEFQVQRTKSMSCPLCNESEFQQVSRLKRHIIENHLKLKVKCEFCDMSLVRKNELKNHMILKHKDEEGLDRVVEAWDKVRRMQISELEYNEKEIPESVRDIICRKRRVIQEDT